MTNTPQPLPTHHFQLQDVIAGFPFAAVFRHNPKSFDVVCDPS
jgi:hypothetical protein